MAGWVCGIQKHLAWIAERRNYVECSICRMLKKLIQLESVPFLHFWLSWIINRFWQPEEWIVANCLPISIATKCLKGIPVAVQSTCIVPYFEVFLEMVAGGVKFVFNILYVGVRRLLTIDTYRIFQCRIGVLSSSINFFESFYIHCIPQVVTQANPNSFLLFPHHTITKGV